jgi:hypothetical protein
VFAISPDMPRDLQILEVVLAVPAEASAAALYVDGRKAGALAGPPWIFDWILEPGEHVLAARAGGAETSPVTIFVE